MNEKTDHVLVVVRLVPRNVRPDVTEKSSNRNLSNFSCWGSFINIHAICMECFMTDNVLTFPKEKIIREVPFHNEKLEEIKAKGTQNFADAIVHDIAENILNEFGGVGLNTEAETFSKDFQLLINVLTTTVYRSVGLPHPFQKIIDENFDFVPVEQIELDKPQ